MEVWSKILVISRNDCKFINHLQITEIMLKKGDKLTKIFKHDPGLIRGDFYISDRSYMVLAMLNSTLVTVSVHYRPAVAAGSGNEDPGSPVHQSNSSNSLFDK